jgi:hypothetical protein
MELVEDSYEHTTVHITLSTCYKYKRAKRLAMHPNHDFVLLVHVLTD